MVSEIKLPDRPSPARPGIPESPYPPVRKSYWSEEEMDEYARAAVLADRAQRVPLTEAQLQRLGLDMPADPMPGYLLRFARAIEAAHGITEKP